MLSVSDRLSRLAVVLVGAATAVLVLWGLVAPQDLGARPAPGFALVFGALLAACQLVLSAWALGTRLSELAVGACWLWLFAAPGLFLLIGMPVLAVTDPGPGASGGERAAGVLGSLLGGALVLALPAAAAVLNLPRWRRYALAIALWTAAVAALALSLVRESRLVPLEAGSPSPGRTAAASLPRFPAALPLAALAAAAAVSTSVRLARRPPP